jgi:cytochrome c
MKFLAALLLLAGSAAAEPSLFTQCAACHANPAGNSGPSLHGVVGRAAGSLRGFNYSAAMRRTGFKWTPEKLNAFLQDPQSVVPGTRMAFAGVDDEAQAGELVEFLKGY